jgi:hypothetical protein
VKFNCGPTPAERWEIKRKKQEERDRYLAKWHPIFAWFPTRVGSNDCRWLETIERRIRRDKVFSFILEIEFRPLKRKRA